MKRFIAGAVCPTCQNNDTLYFETDVEEDIVSCTRCDYSELRPSSEQGNNTHQDKEADKKIKWN